MRYRLGLDLGANSLDWCIVELDENNVPIRLIRLGVRLFRDGRNPKDKQSLAVARRLARGMRRRRDRWLKRQRRFRDALIRHGLMPADETARKALVSLDPYGLRRDALDTALPPHNVGRALFHLNQRRGFKSNRKTDKADDNESGKIKSALARVREELKERGARTIGEWLAGRHFNTEKDADGSERLKPLAVRARLQGQGAKAAYNLYLGRGMIADEFDAIWNAQAARNPDLFTAEAAAELREILLHQRNLKPVTPGKCTIDPDDPQGRAPLALPSAQRFRILQELNNLRYTRVLGEDTALSLEQRNQFAEILEGRGGGGRKEKADSKGKLTFEKMRQLLKLPPEAPFNLQSGKRDGLKGNATSLVLSNKDRFGDRWHALSLASQNAIVEKLLIEESESAVVEWLRAEHGLDESAAIKIANTGLADGHINLGRRALVRVLPELERDVISYRDAVIAAEYDPTDHTGEIVDVLPYYGKLLERHVGFGSGNPKHSDEKRYGRIANPTVHIGLNQLRRIVNAVIERYGPPTQIALEVTRELKMSEEQRRRKTEEQAKFQKQNEEDNAELRQLGLREFGENLLRMKLWRELNIRDPLDRRCPYTGRQISREKLFSEEVEIEHILPFSKTLDDSIPNKTVAFRDANRYKGNRSPAEAFAQSANGYDWAAIQARAENMPKNKAWRFAENAMQKFDAEHRDFLARHLNDTAYLSRIAKAYLSYVCFQDVGVTPGRLTAMLRGKWGLNPQGGKDRSDQRHHAIDAAVIAVTDRGLLQRIATASARERLERDRDRIIADEPWEGFRDAVKTALARTVISYRPDHGHEAGLHNDTAYGFAEPYQPGKISTVVHRVPLGSLQKPDDLEGVRDDDLRKRLREHVGGAAGKEFIAKIAEFGQQTGIRHVRVVEQLTVIPMKRDSEEQPYKAYKGDGNYCVEIYRDEKGRWRDYIVTSFEAHQIIRMAGGKERLRHRTLAQNGQSLVMRLCNEDVVAMDLTEAARRLFRVNNISRNGQIFFAELHEGNTDGRNRDKSDPFTYLSKKASSLFDAKARRVFVTELGFVRDPGFKP